MLEDIPNKLNEIIQQNQHHQFEYRNNLDDTNSFRQNMVLKGNTDQYYGL